MRQAEELSKYNQNHFWKFSNNSQDMTRRQITRTRQRWKINLFQHITIHLLEASKPPEGAGVVDTGSNAAGTIGAAATAAGTGGAGAERDPRASKLDSRRSPCTRAGAKAGARAGAAVGARVGDIRPEGGTESTVTVTSGGTAIRPRETHIKDDH